jgi:hypothetical protein
LNEIEVKEILLEITKSLESFDKNNIEYNCLIDHNVLRRKSRWELSLAGALSNGYLMDKSFFDAKRKSKEGVFYALGSLIFKMLFGFVPFE